MRSNKMVNLLLPLANLAKASLFAQTKVIWQCGSVLRITIALQENKPMTLLESGNPSVLREFRYLEVQ